MTLLQPAWLTSFAPIEKIPYSENVMPKICVMKSVVNMTEVFYVRQAKYPPIKKRMTNINSCHFYDSSSHFQLFSLIKYT